MIFPAQKEKGSEDQTPETSRQSIETIDEIHRIGKPGQSEKSERDRQKTETYLHPKIRPYFVDQHSIIPKNECGQSDDEKFETR